MAVTVEALQEALAGRQLPGGQLVIEPYEAFIGEEALRSAPDPQGSAHPAWLIIASLRCMGITVEELCALAHQAEGDTLLFGNCRVEQFSVLRTGHRYTASAAIREISSRTTRDGSRLDRIEVLVRLQDAASAADVGQVVSTYLFKRGTEE